jgi:hypothetical protein
MSKGRQDSDIRNQYNGLHTVMHVSRKRQLGTYRTSLIRLILFNIDCYELLNERFWKSFPFVLSISVYEFHIVCLCEAIVINWIDDIKRTFFSSIESKISTNFLVCSYGFTHHSLTLMSDQGNILVLHQCEMSFRDLHIIIYTDLLSRNSGHEKIFAIIINIKTVFFILCFLLTFLRLSII